MAKVTKKKTAAKKKAGTTKKSVTTKKKASVKKSVKHVTPKTSLTPKQLKHFKDLLMIKLHELLGDYNQMESDALKKTRNESAGDLSSMPIHMADLGSDNFEQEFTLGLLHGERKLLKEIHDALDRIENNTYGVCEGTDKPISTARLEAKPWARYCIEYARMVEQGLIVEGEKVYDEEDDADRDIDEDELEGEDDNEESDEYELDEFIRSDDDDDIDLDTIDEM